MRMIRVDMLALATLHRMERCKAIPIFVIEQAAQQAWGFGVEAIPTGMDILSHQSSHFFPQFPVDDGRVLSKVSDP